MNVNTSQYFCNEKISVGDPLSFVGFNGYPIVSRYNGSKYIGISANNVVELDLTKERAIYENVQVGGSIQVIKSGFVFIPLLEGEMLQYIKPVKKFPYWKVTNKQKKKSIGQITDINSRGCLVKLF